MSPRVDRLRQLADELVDALRRHPIEEDEPAAADAALRLLDRLARCEVYPIHEIEGAGVAAILETATSTREAEATSLAEKAAHGIDGQALLERGYRLAGGDSEAGAVEAWAREILLVANVTPWLSEPLQARGASVVEDGIGIIESSPAAFVSAASLAEDRLRHEHPEAIADTLGIDLLHALAAAPELARVDAGLDDGSLYLSTDELGPERLDAGTDNELLLAWTEVPERARVEPRPRLRARYCRSLPQVPEESGASFSHLASVPADSKSSPRWLEAALEKLPLEQVEEAAQALRDARSWGTNVVALRRKARAATEESGPIRLAARRSQPGEHVLLRRLDEGELVLTRLDDTLYLDWYGAASASLEVNGLRVDAADEAIEGGTRWRLPTTEGELRIDARSGPHRIRMALPS